MYHSLQDLIDQANSRQVSLARIVLENEMALSDKTEEEVYELLDRHYEVMVASAQRALTQPQEMVGGLIKGQAARQYKYQNPLCGEYLNRLMAMALSGSEVNASMGLVCAAPTGGASGILPAVLLATGEKLGSSRRQLLDALLVASGVGAVITKNATVSGAEGGCQAECGAAAAMGAAAVVFLSGGSPEACAHAVAIALMNCMGLICDPVAGMVQLPCAYRNASQAVNAIISADLALAGQSSVIPADEVIEAMYRVGRMLPVELRETALGGIAASKTAKEIAKQLAEQDTND
ncbi:MAG: L-serine ammonia-lyase, iron-sulfur-dependent, subunit alpha [Firmicutes bacterium]|nr:L-serine ammonia-lyase, iron-sulfur-dependent, subunit alpha [Bacillota bacterium]